MNHLSRIRCGMPSPFSASSLAAPLFSVEAPVPGSTGSGAIPFRPTILDISPDLVRPAKAVGGMNGDSFSNIVCCGNSGLFWYDCPTNHHAQPW